VPGHRSRRLVASVALAILIPVVPTGIATMALAISPPPPTPVPVRCAPPPIPSPTAAPTGTPSAAPTGTPSAAPTGTPASPSAPAPVPVPAPSVCSSPSPFPTVLVTPTPSLEPPTIRARAAVLEDLHTGEVLFSLHPDERRPVASLTKLMTALLVLRSAHPSEVVTVGPDAAAQGAQILGVSELGLKLGERITVAQLLYALLLQSANDAAVALADHVSGSVDAFVADMATEAARLGLHRTHFLSPNGLDDRGFTTARELAAISRQDFRIPLFAKIARSKFHDIPAPSGPPRHIQNRNALLWLYPGAIGGKTGYTSSAGYCLMAAARRHGRSVLALVLGEPSTFNSFDDAAALLDYGFHAFTEKTLITEGAALPPVPLGTERIPVAAGRGLRRLIRVEQAGQVTRRVALSPRLVGPVAVGGRIGTVTFAAGDEVLGSVPLVVAALPRPGPRRTSTDPWWRRGLASIGHFAAHAIGSLFG
jgi:D-alanyl-D-alanine carboxypeptidase (penicillin-binding protein 5/6)